MVFAYGETELAWLRKKDKRLGEVIDRIGHVDRAVDPDLFSAVIHRAVDVPDAVDDRAKPLVLFPQPSKLRFCVFEKHDRHLLAFPV